MPHPDACPGPVIWYYVPHTDRPCPAPQIPCGQGHCYGCAPNALLECAASGCGYIIASGPTAVNDWRHATTPLLKEGLAS